MSPPFRFPFKEFVRPLLSLGLLVGALSSLCQATTLTISNGLGSFLYNDSSLAGDSFAYDDSGDTLYQESWYLNISGSATILTGGTLSNVSSDAATITYSPSGGFSVVESIAITYTITDTGSAGILNASVAVTAGNAGATFSLINYFDYDLGAFGNDSAVFDASTGRMTISDGDANPGPDVIRQGALFDNWEIDSYSSLQTRIGNGQLLAGSGSPFGPADFTGAMQWDFDLAANEEEEVNVGGGGSIGEAVPEVSHAVPLGLLIGTGLLLRRRKNSIS